MKIFSIQLVAFVFVLGLGIVQPGFCLDSTGFNPATVSVQSVGSSIPVGTVITWPSSSWPPDADNWLECNGQAINSTVYPELVALVGARVPDYRGIFLRGVGGNAAPLGILQQDELKSHSHSIPARTQHRGLDHDDSIEYDIGVERYQITGETGYTGENETRPINRSVRYLIRAR